MSKVPPAYQDVGYVNRQDAISNSTSTSKRVVDPESVGGPCTQVAPVVTGEPPYSTPSSGVLGFYIPHQSVGLDTGPDSYVQQSAKEECNILNILKTYNNTGIITHSNPNKPIYTDLPDQHDYQEALQMVQEGMDAFASLPSSLRRHFNDDPEYFLHALHDPKQRKFLEDAGIFEKTPEPSSPSPVTPAVSPSAGDDPKA